MKSHFHDWMSTKTHFEKEATGNSEMAYYTVSMSCCHNHDASKAQNLHFDDQSKKVVFFIFVVVFSERNRKHVLCISDCRQFLTDVNLSN